MSIVPTLSERRVMTPMLGVNASRYAHALASDPVYYGYKHIIESKQSEPVT